MKDWKEKDMKFINNTKYFPNCIECSDHWLDTNLMDFFHKEDCERGMKNWEVTDERLKKRLEVFEKMHGVNGGGISCKECGEPAVGVMHILYHNTEITVEEWPVCMDHAFHEDSAGRESQFRGF